MRRYVVLYTPDKNGVCKVDHITAKLEQDEDAEWPEEYPVPEIPEEGQEIWDWYWEIRQGVAKGVNGVEPISHVEIAAWGGLVGVEVTPQILRFLRILDRQFVSDRSKELSKITKQPKQQRPIRPAKRR